MKILHVLDGEGGTPLSVPFFGHDLLGDDIKGSWTQWPKKHVLLSTEVKVLLCSYMVLYLFIVMTLQKNINILELV